MRIVQQTAPVLRGKHLEYFRQSLLSAYDWAYFKYVPLQADAIWSQYETRMLAGQLSVQEALRQAIQQIDALEVAGVGESAAVARDATQARAALAQRRRRQRPRCRPGSAPTP